MEGNLDVQTGGSKPNLSNVDITKWLADNKLQKIEKTFRERDISLEEIVEFNENELNDLANDLQLDTLAKKRFIKAIQDLQPKDKQSSSNSNIQPSSSTNNNLNVLQANLSPSEQKARQKLLLAQDKTAQLVNNIQSCFVGLDSSAQDCKVAIEKEFEDLFKELAAKEKHLLTQIDALKSGKVQQLQQQSTVLKQYCGMINEGRSKYETYTTDQTIDIMKRKKMVSDMANGILFYPGIALLFITQPKLEMKDYKPVLSSFIKNLVIDDCDRPFPFFVSITKAKTDNISIEWRMHARDAKTQSVKPMLQISIEWASLPKSDVPKPDSKIFQSKKDDKNAGTDSNNQSLDQPRKSQSKIASIFGWFKRSSLPGTTTTTSPTIAENEEPKDKNDDDKDKKKK